MFKPGDLVILIKPTHCCNNATNVGKIFTVTEDWSSHPGAHCYFCNKTTALRTGAWTPLNNYYCESHRLKKIEPLSETEETRSAYSGTNEELYAH